MKRLLVGVAFLACACSPALTTNTGEEEPAVAQSATSETHAAADRTGNRLEAMVRRGAKQCSNDGAWCIDATGLITGPNGVERVIQGSVRDSEEQAPWPWIIRLSGDDQRALIGQTFSHTEGYSGGSASDTWLTLYEVSGANDQAIAVMSALIDGSAMIRACFDEDDVRERFEACHDEYRFSGAINLDTSTASGTPRLIYTTQASTFPGRRSRTSDSAEAPPRSRDDLVWAVDESCSFRRVFSWSSSASAYTPNTPPPACEDYQTQ
jgi:hypothetical protein